MKEGLIKDAYELILKEIQTVITILYLLMIGVGMLFNYKKYSLFRINIFEYADVFDFLIAPFQDFRIIMVSVLVLLIPSGLLWSDIYVEKKWPKFYSIINLGLSAKNWFRRLKFTLFGFLLLYFLSEGASGYGNFLKNNIDAHQSVTVELTNNEVIDARLIGKTKEVLFLYTNDKVKIIPLNSSVKEIEIN